MAKPDHLRLKDIRAAYRLIGECCELGSDPRAWRLHMLGGLRRLTGAQVAIYMLLHDVGTGGERVSDTLDAGFLDVRERGLWAHYQLEQAHLDDPFHHAFLRDFKGPIRTRRLKSVIHADEWYRSRHYNEYVRACRLDDRITTSLQLSDAAPALQTVVLHRAVADGQYSRRDQRLVHLFHHELGRLLGSRLALPEAHGGEPELPHRLQQVLACLLEGDREKQIAARLALSPHTVNHHVQRLYRKFHVHSRGELMIRCADMLPALARAE